MSKRIFAFLLAAMMLLSCTSALAANVWACDNCGAADNSGNFCPGCGSAKPIAEDAPWNCVCGTKNNTGKFCPVCGKDKSNAVTGNVPAANSKVKVGQYVKFGSFEQDGNDVNGKEPIQWLVLAVEGNKALLISRYGLSRQPFNKTSSGETWEDCGLRTWMNKTFYKAAFTYDQQQSILTTTIKEDISQCSGDFPPNRLGNNTQDKVFTLSYVEMTKYLPTDYDRLCVPTEAAILEDCNESDRRYLDDEEKTCWYWMRSPAYNNNILVVGWEGEIDTCYMSHYYGVARPAMWVECSALK